LTLFAQHFLARSSPKNWRKTSLQPMDQENGNISLGQVSGFYGPGTYCAWLITMFSAAINSKQRKRPSVDFISAIVYVLISCADMTLRYKSGSGDFQARAALHIVYVASCCSCILLLLTLSKVWATFLHFTLVMILNPIIDEKKFRFPFSKSRNDNVGIWPALLSGVFIWIGFAHYYGTYFIPVLIQFIVVHGIVEASGYRPMSFFPHTGASLSDLDQAAALATAIMLFLYQWKTWRVVNRPLRYIGGHIPFSNSWQMSNTDRLA
jgi:hypothetical protein